MDVGIACCFENSIYYNEQLYFFICADDIIKSFTRDTVSKWTNVNILDGPSSRTGSQIILSCLYGWQFHYNFQIHRINPFQKYDYAIIRCTKILYYVITNNEVTITHDITKFTNYVYQVDQNTPLLSNMWKPFKWDAKLLLL